MSTINRNSERSAGHPGPVILPRRKPDFAVWLAGIGVAAAVVSILIYQVVVGWQKGGAPRPTQPVISEEAAVGDSAPESLAKPTLAETSKAGEMASKPRDANHDAQLSGDPLEVSQQLIARLAKLDLSKGLTPEVARQVNETFKQLIAQGPAGIPAIRAFLERNEDLDFGKLQGGNLADYGSLRMGLIDALKQVGGPEAMAVSLQTLQTTTNPAEVAVLARDLEQQAPGQYRQQAVAAATQGLSRAMAAGTGEQNVAPLFQVLQSYGDASVVGDLEKALPRWGYYAAITLANLPGGEGIPSLTRMAQDPNAVANGQSDIAMRMLAQVSSDNPQASAALLQMARENQISGSAWNAIASGLAGYNLELGSPLVSGATSSAGGSGLSTFHVEDGGQNLFTTPLRASWLDEQVNSRLGLIDQLLSANPDPTVIEDLQQARASLTNMMAVAITSTPH